VEVDMDFRYPGPRIEFRPNPDGTIQLDIIMPAGGHCAVISYHMTPDEVDALARASVEADRLKRELTNMFFRVSMNASS